MQDPLAIQALPSSFSKPINSVSYSNPLGVFDVCWLLKVGISIFLHRSDMESEEQLRLQKTILTSASPVLQIQYCLVWCNGGSNHQYLEHYLKNTGLHDRFPQSSVDQQSAQLHHQRLLARRTTANFWFRWKRAFNVILSVTIRPVHSNQKLHGVLFSQFDPAMSQSKCLGVYGPVHWSPIRVVAQSFGDM